MSAPSAALVLPLTLRIRRVTVTVTSIEIEGAVTDAEDVSVQAIALNVGRQHSLSSLHAIVQEHVDALARALLRSGRARHGDADESDEDIKSALEGQDFRGSVAK